MEAWIQESNPPASDEKKNYDELMLTKNFGKPELTKVFTPEGGHGGGDKLLKDKIFIPGTADTLRQSACVRDSALCCLIGIAARNNCDSGKPVKIGDLTTIQPAVKKEKYRFDLYISPILFYIKILRYPVYLPNPTVQKFYEISVITYWRK